MKPDTDYLKDLLTAFQGSPYPNTNLAELEKKGFSTDDPRFEFHMLLLADSGYIRGESTKPGIGLQRIGHGSYWSVIPLRLTASGHEFAEALTTPKVFQAIQKDFVGASIGTLRDAALALFKAEISRHLGLHF